MIREAKRSDIVETIFKTLGMKKRQQQNSTLPDVEVMNDFL